MINQDKIHIFGIIVRKLCLMYMLLVPLHVYAMSFDSSKCVFLCDPLSHSTSVTKYTTTEDGRQIQFTAKNGVFQMMCDNKEVLTINGIDYMGYKVDEISTSSPSKRFWLIRSLAGARGIEFEFWVVGQQSNGKFVQFLTPEAVRNSGYDPLNKHYLYMELKSDRLSLTAKDEYMPEGAYYGYQRAYRPAYQVELFWDDKADWFGIDRIL